VAILGFASGPGNSGRVSRDTVSRSSVVDRVSAYTSDAVLPTYLLHQTVIVLLAIYVVEWPIGATLKYLIICVVSLLVILTIYDVGVRRTRPTRFLFGMKTPQS
jgi:hypothetical protein